MAKPGKSVHCASTWRVAQMKPTDKIKLLAGTQADNSLAATEELQY
jgi:hypothetical protein